jgi:hypothetical protein
MAPPLLLDERILADGGHARTWAEVDGGQVRIWDDAAAGGALSVAALDKVMLRYARPLDPEIALDGPCLELGDGRRLRRLRYHTPVDAMGRDYLVWERPGEEPLAVIATMVTAALRYLVSRLGAGATGSEI